MWNTYENFLPKKIVVRQKQRSNTNQENKEVTQTKKRLRHTCELFAKHQCSVEHSLRNTAILTVVNYAAA